MNNEIIEAIQKSIEHHLRMQNWVKINCDMTHIKHDGKMKREIGEYWFADDCDLCYFFDLECSECPLGLKYGACGSEEPINGNEVNAWGDIQRAKTWKEWLEADRKLVNQLISLLSKPNPSTIIIEKG